MTSALDGILAFVLAAILNLVVAFRIRARAHPSEAGLLVRLFLWTIGIRYTFAVLLNAFALDSAFASAFWGDSGTYDIGAHQLALKWSGEPIATIPQSRAVSGYGWVYFIGSIYFVAGRNQLLIQFLNGLMGGLTMLVIYAIAARLFDRASARWAAVFMAFFPQVIFWSAGMYKDPPILLSIALAMYAVVRLRERFSLAMVVLFVMAEVALVTLRFYIAYFVLFAALATFVFAQRHGVVRMVVTYSILLGLLFGALGVAVQRDTLERQATYLTLERVQITREDQAMWGQSGFGREHDVSTPSGALAALPTGLVYLLFAPFPWAVSGLRQALAMPETLVWYALMPAFVRGVRIAVKTQFRAILPILVFAVSLTGAYALMQGNVGTAYRQRTQVTIFFFIFMGVGIVERRRQREGQSAMAPSPAWQRSP
jgi:4-amino-4-deoxy-L-arabinose transferase-like glycosyltransferase